MWMGFLSKDRAGLAERGSVSFARAPASRNILFFCLCFGRIRVRLLGLQKAENFSVGTKGKWENGDRRYEDTCVCLLERTW